MRRGGLIVLGVVTCVGLSTATGCGGPVRLDGDRAAFDRSRATGPDEAERMSRAGAWLMGQVRVVEHPAFEPGAIRAVAWKDPTLDPHLPDRLAGYLSIDTLYASRAIALYDQAAGEAMARSLRLLDADGNGLHEVILRGVSGPLRHKPVGDDIVHGDSLGVFAADDGREVDLRVSRYEADPAFAAGHPALFAEHAVYEALDEWWRGERDAARRRVRDAVTDGSSATLERPILWDPRGGVVVDYVTFDEWRAMRAGRRESCRVYTFKVAQLLYAIRLMGMDAEPGIAEIAAGMRRRIWSAQHPDGGIAHYVDVAPDGTVVSRGIGSTGEATALAVLEGAVVADE